MCFEVVTLRIAYTEKTKNLPVSQLVLFFVR